MDLYRIRLPQHHGRTLGWAGTQREAHGLVHKAKELGYTDAEFVPENVPTDKQGLLTWLRDNTAHSIHGDAAAPLASPAVGPDSQGGPLSAESEQEDLGNQ